VTLTMIPELEASDVEAILAPLAGDQPTGVDLRQDFAPTSIYFKLRDARAQARDAERQADSQGGDEGQPTLWRPVATMAIGALKASSKDLEVATWLTEALVRMAGLRGLMAGALVIAGLVDRYWDGLYPMPDDTGMEARVAAIAGLSGQGADGTLMQPLRKVSLFNRPDGTPFTLWQYQASVELSGITDSARRAQRIDSGVLPFEEVEKVGAARHDRQGACVVEGDGARTRREGRSSEPRRQSSARSPAVCIGNLPQVCATAGGCDGW
jgi:type VI secretion system protein ImpA